MIFDPSVAPKDRISFMRWFEKQTDWDQSHDYMDPCSTSVLLRNWYDAIRKEYPAMNGPDACNGEAIDRSGDYNFGPHFIYITYPWSLAEEIYEKVRALVVEHKVGFFDVSDDVGGQEIYFPGDQLAPPSQGQWREVSRQFQEIQQN